MPAVADLLRAHDGAAWRPKLPATADAVSAVEGELGVTFEESYRELLLLSDGGVLAGNPERVLFTPTRDLVEFNHDPEWSTALPGMLLFGNDGGDYLYYFDPANRLKRGAWAVYWVEMGSVGVDDSVWLAPDLLRFLQRIVNGERFGGPYLKDAPPR